jgi:hypothetical protein
LNTLKRRNPRTRLDVAVSSSAAVVASVSPGQRGQTAANTYDTASVPPVAGDDPVNETDPSGLSDSAYGQSDVGTGISLSIGGACSGALTLDSLTTVYHQPLPVFYVSPGIPSAELKDMAVTEIVQYDYRNNSLQWVIEPTWHTVAFFNDTRAGVADGRYVVNESAVSKPTYHEGPAQQINYKFHSFVNEYFLARNSTQGVILKPGDRVDLNFDYDALRAEGRVLTAGFTVHVE